jgi:hypothetical protein
VFTTPNLHSAQAKLLFALGDRLKQFDAKGDPTHITPIVLFPFTRLLNRHGLTVLESWGFPLVVCAAVHAIPPLVTRP